MTIKNNYSITHITDTEKDSGERYLECMTNEGDVLHVFGNTNIDKLTQQQSTDFPFGIELDSTNIHQDNNIIIIEANAHLQIIEQGITHGQYLQSEAKEELKEEMKEE